MTTYARFRSRLADGLDATMHPIEWVDWAVSNNLVTCFTSANSALLCEIRNYPGGARIGGVIHGCGDMAELIEEVMPQTLEWARAGGCQRVIVEGRLGWVRKLQKHGFEPHSASVSLTL